MDKSRQNRKFQSVAYRIVLWPILVFLLILIFMISAAIMTFQQMRNEIIERNKNALSISMSQIENVILQCETEVANYLTYDTSYKVLRAASEEATNEELFLSLAQTGDWMNQLVARTDYVNGAFVYYGNIDQMLFRGTAETQVHRFIYDEIQMQNANWNTWIVQKIENKNYLILLDRFNDVYLGCWIDLDQMLNEMGVSNENYPGPVYLEDGSENLVSIDLTDAQLKQINSQDRGSEIITVAMENDENIRLNRYWSYMSNHPIKAAILIRNEILLNNISIYGKMLYVFGVISIMILIYLIYWIQKMIREPVAQLGQAMKEVGKGNLEYRIEIEEHKTYTEFDMLKEQMNQMMDEVDELQYSLYHTKMRAQEIKLRYISQQIRPHFILNALNIIYTYKESEFPLVKNMVLYLTNYFRYIVNLKRDFVEVEKEMRHTENYLKIQKERYLDKFEFFVEWEQQVSNYLIPPLIIQTFVENSIKYAINEEKLFIYVLAGKEGDYLKILMADTGQGFTQQILNGINEFIRTGKNQEEFGVGITNAIERLDILYEGKAKLLARNALSGGAVIELYVPFMENKDMVTDRTD